MSAVFLVFGLPGIRAPVSVPDHARLQQSLHAYVQVRPGVRLSVVCISLTLQPDHLACTHSSLVVGARSHKLVTKNVSRILWYYYNDPVSRHFLGRPERAIFTSTDLLPTEHSLPVLRRERALLRRALPDAL